MGTIEYINGQESHTSNWSKFYVKGLAEFAVKEDFRENKHDRHHDYQGYVAVDVPDGTVFTIFDQHGNKYGPAKWGYSVAVVDIGHEERAEHGIDKGKISGRFRIIVHAEGMTKAPRLMDWWKMRPCDADPVAYAAHCAAHIEKRGLKDLPAMS